MMRRVEYGRPAAIVMGAGEIGSAIAVALHRAGYAVVLTDGVDPAWARRGMAFTNAWYIGNAELDGEAAVFCASLKSIPSVLDRRGAIAATTWSSAGVAAALEPAVIVDATLGAKSTGVPPRSRNPGNMLTMALLPPNVADPAVDVAIECPPDMALAAGTGNLVRASHSGRFATIRRIGDRVGAGDVVGAIGPIPVVAPCDGVLRGLSARGARVIEGSLVVDVDPRGDPVLCFGLDEAAVATGREVLRALAHSALAPSVSVTLPRAGSEAIDAR